MKFLANMGISPVTVVFLRRLGHEAIHLHELGHDRMLDPDILALARRDEQIVLTSDLGFGDLLAHSGAELPSVIYNLSPSRYVAANDVESPLPLEEALVLLAQAEEARGEADAELDAVL